MRFLSDSEISAAAEQVLSEGYAVLRGVVAPIKVEAMADAHAPLLESFVDSGALESNRGSARYYLPLPFTDPFADPEVFANEALLGVVSRIVGKNPRMCELATDTPLYGSDYQPVHRDTGALFPGFETEPPAYQLAVNFPLCDVTSDEIGPLEVLPGGTHMWTVEEGEKRLENDLAAVERSLVPIHMSIGDVLIRDVRALHRGTPNRTQSPRPMVVMGYSRSWWRRPEVGLRISNSVFEALEPSHRALVERDAVICQDGEEMLVDVNAYDEQSLQKVSGKSFSAPLRPGGGASPRRSESKIRMRAFSTRRSTARFGASAGRRSLSTEASASNKVIRTVVIDNLPRWVQWQELKDLGRDYGDVEFAQVGGFDADTTSGILQYRNAGDAQKALSALNQNTVRLGGTNMQLNAREGNPVDEYNRDPNESFEAKVRRRKNNREVLTGAIDCAVFVDNIPFSMEWVDLKDLGRKYGQAIFAGVHAPKHGTGVKTGVLKFSSSEEAERAIEGLNQTEIQGITLFARAWENKKGRHGKHWISIKGCPPTMTWREAKQLLDEYRVGYTVMERCDTTLTNEIFAKFKDRNFAMKAAESFQDRQLMGYTLETEFIGEIYEEQRGYHEEEQRKPHPWE